MTAEEYFKKHTPMALMVSEEALGQELFKILYEFNEETISIQKARDVHEDKDIALIIRDQNRKWNEMVTLFQAANIPCAVIHDGYRRFWATKLRGLENMVKKW